MNFDEEIEDSLRVCEELKSYIKNDHITASAPRVEPQQTTPPPAPRVEPQQTTPPPAPRVEPQQTTPPPAPRVEPQQPVSQYKEDVVQPVSAFSITPSVNSSDDKQEKPAPKRINKQAGAGEEYREVHPVLHVFLNCFICIAAALVLSLLITRFVAHHTSVEGSSMEPTLHSGDQLIVEKMSYYFSDPDRFDVIVFPYTEDVSYIKRIIGLPNETIQIVNGNIYIDGELLNESYGREIIQDPGLAADEIKLGEDEYFVLGDNRNASEDSRKSEVGTIKRSQIQGKAWIRFYPFDDFENIE